MQTHPHTLAKTKRRIKTSIHKGNGTAARPHSNHKNDNRCATAKVRCGISSPTQQDAPCEAMPVEQRTFSTSQLSVRDCCRCQLCGRGHRRPPLINRLSRCRLSRCRDKLLWAPPSHASTTGNILALHCSCLCHPWRRLGPHQKSRRSTQNYENVAAGEIPSSRTAFFMPLRNYKLKSCSFFRHCASKFRCCGEFSESSPGFRVVCQPSGGVGF